ncbi:MAG: HlyC/CorC family transporter [Clostridia bacterium]|nr:HlyC/CorC family transporter [Clostridia bacterium]
MTTQILLMVLMLVLSAYFSATETAFSSMNKTRLKTFVEKGNRRAALALSLVEKYDNLLSTILIGNNIVNIALASMGTIFFVETVALGDIGTTVSTAVITVAVLIFGEITPKSIAKDMPERFAMFSAPVIQLLIWIFTPFTFLFAQWKKLLSKIFRSRDDGKISQEELLLLVDEVQQEGSIDNNEGNLLRNAIEFTELRAEDILTHRVDLAAVPTDAEKSEIAEKFAQTQFSRLLVYEETIDKIVGVIHQKDFYTASGITELPLEALMAPAVFIHQSEKISQLLKTLQKNKTHIAVVLDEYGGTLGIVTMEDILEELVGEIWDEHDEVVENYKDLGDGRYRVDCSVNLDDFSEFFSVELESEAVSLGGLIMELHEDLPEVGSVVTCAGLEITVAEMDSHRVVYAEVVRLPEEDPEEELSSDSEE